MEIQLCVRSTTEEWRVSWIIFFFHILFILISRYLIWFHFSLYVRGAEVKLKIKELELSSRFLGEEKDLTILEADCILLGLISTPKSQKKGFTRKDSL